MEIWGTPFTSMRLNAMDTPVVKEIGGHGIGLEFHEDPWVSYTSEEGSGVLDGSRHDVYH